MKKKIPYFFDLFILINKFNLLGVNNLGQIKKMLKLIEKILLTIFILSLTIVVFKIVIYDFVIKAFIN